jgi:adenosylcobinamide-GDP ribazoletransferase
MIKNFITALQFLTIVTLKKEHRVEEGDLARSMAFFPLIGFLLGFLLNSADKAMSYVLPQSIENALLLVVSLLITRALHVDGFADTLDGIMGGHDPQSRLAIMKDSRLGTAGALGIMCLLLVKYLCFNNLFESEKIAALLVAPMLARWSQTLMVFKAEYVREQGMGKAFVGHLRTNNLAAASAVAIGLSAFVIVRLDPRSLLLFSCLLCAVVLTTALGRKYFNRKLGGVTGDAIGAVSELNEVLVLLLFVIFSSGN